MQVQSDHAPRTASFHDVIRGFYDRHWQRKLQESPAPHLSPQRSERLVELAAQYGHPCVALDIGCGTGIHLEAFSRLPGVKRLIGVDPSPTAVAEARRRLPSAEIHEALAEHLEPIEDGACDVVCLCSVMEHILDTHQALNEINRVLKPEGIVVLYTTDMNWLKKVLIAALCFERYFDVTSGHIRFYTSRSLRKVMEVHGFRRIHYEWARSYAGLMPQGQHAVYRKLTACHFLPTDERNTV